MGLERVLQGFQENMKVTSHLQVLFKDKPFVIDIENATEIYTLSLSTNDITLTKNNSNGERRDVIIKAKEESVLIKLLSGADRLQRLKNWNELSLEGNYAAILKAEAIFYLVVN